MFTSIDKALIALVMGLLFIIQTYTGHVLGGNQGDRVSIKRIAKGRLIGAQRCPWRINQPSNVRRIELAAGGKLSTNEA